MSHCVRASKYRIDILLRGAKGFSGFSVCWCWAAFFTWLGSIQNQRIPGSAGSEGKWGANLFQEEIRFIQEGPWQGWGAWNENHILPSQTHPFLHLKCSSHGRWSLVRKFFLSRQVSKLQCTIVTVKCLVFILLKDTVRYVGRNYPALWVIFPSNDHPPTLLLDYKSPLFLLYLGLSPVPHWGLFPPSANSPEYNLFLLWLLSSSGFLWHQSPKHEHKLLWWLHDFWP